MQDRIGVQHAVGADGPTRQQGTAARRLRNPMCRQRRQCIDEQVCPVASSDGDEIACHGNDYAVNLVLVGRQLAVHVGCGNFRQRGGRRRAQAEDRQRPVACDVDPAVGHCGHDIGVAADVARLSAAFRS